MVGVIYKGEGIPSKFFDGFLRNKDENEVGWRCAEHLGCTLLWQYYKNKELGKSKNHWANFSNWKHFLIHTDTGVY